MKLSENLLEEYTKKILGFAYEKTGNSYEAEELAQEIMLQLLSCKSKQIEVEHLSSFIYTVSCYTWSKYLRKNKKYRDYEELEKLEVADVTQDVEINVTDKILYMRLRKVISSLAKTQREIIVMHYYDNKTTSEIGRLLNMNENTVRWYLGSIRNSLKEKLNMRENLDFTPVSLCVGIDGTMMNMENFKGLESDLLIQNIALACYGEPLTITEISEKLNVAAAYLERHLEHMVYMDFLRINGKKYQTNFFISNREIELAKAIYGYENAAPYAEKVYDAVMAKKNEILSIDYFGKGNVKEEHFLWYVLLKTAQEKAYEQMQKEWDICKLMRPIRKDGSEYWIISNTIFMNDLEEGPLRNYLSYRCCKGYKSSIDDYIGGVYQADTYFSIDIGFRKITEGQNHLKVLHLAEAIMKADREGREMNDIEKLYVSEFVKEGYVEMKDGRPVLKVPVFTFEQMKKLDGIVNEIKQGLGDNFLKEYLNGYSKMMDRFIPKFLDKNVRNYHKYAMMGGFDMLAHMIREAKEGGKCKLTLPEEEAAKYVMTWIVMK